MRIISSEFVFRRQLFAMYEKTIQFNPTLRNRVYMCLSMRVAYIKCSDGISNCVNCTKINKKFYQK